MGTQLSKHLRRWSIVIVTLVITVILISPIVFMIMTSLKPNAEIFKIPPSFFPKEPTLEIFKQVLDDPDYPKFFRNSYIISISVAVVCVILSLLAGYGFHATGSKGAIIY